MALEKTGQSFKTMAITINGTGTLTGVSVGGLPDGIVDTDMLAAGAVTAAKRGAGAILQVVQTVKSDSFSTNTGSSYVDITGMTVTITPSSSRITSPAPVSIFVTYTCLDSPSLLTSAQE